MRERIAHRRAGNRDQPDKGASISMIRKMQPASAAALNKKKATWHSHWPDVILTRMNRQEILATLRENETFLRARGVSHAALFGSHARGDNRPDSDIDIMIEVDPAAMIGVYEYVALKDYTAELFDGSVDVVSRQGL